MSSDSERMPKPSKRRRVVISDSESSDESIIVRTHRRRKVYRVVSEAESSDDDSDIPRPVIKRRNSRVVSENDTSYDSSGTEAGPANHQAVYISDSDSSAWQSDWESVDEFASEGGNAGGRSKSKSDKKKSECQKQDMVQAATTSTAGFESDSSDGQSEKCPICLLSFNKQQVATPESCDHCFCLDCLVEWSKNINTCPVDRQTFTFIMVRSQLGGKVIKRVPVTVREPTEEQIQEDPTYCEVCQQCDREDRMLLCDGCDLGYHLECLDPPMTEVPMDEWFCPECAQNSQNDAAEVEIDLDEIPDLMEEVRRLGESYGRTRTGRERDLGPVSSPRVIPRTRQTERVRANIRADRNRIREREVRDRETRVRELAFAADQPSTSSGIDSIGENSRSRSCDDSSYKSRAKASGLRARAGTKRKLKPSKRMSKKSSKSKSGTLVREVRILEINDDGEEEEVVTYVKVKAPTARKHKKGTKKTRKVHYHFTKS